MAAGLVQCLVISRYDFREHWDLNKLKIKEASHICYLLLFYFRPDKALPVFFPRAYEKIQMCHIDDLKAERLDNEISYNIFILSEV